MANLITLEGEQAPLASGDEMTPSLEYTLDDPPPPPGDDDTERDQPTPSSEDKSALMFDDPPPPPSANTEIMQPIPAYRDEKTPDFENHPVELPPVELHEDEGYEPNEALVEVEKPQSPVETQPQSIPDEFKPSAIVMPTQMTNPDKDNLPERHQPIYEEVNDKPDNKPDKHEMKEIRNNPGDDENAGKDKEDKKDEKEAKENSEKKHDEKAKDEKEANGDDNKEVEEGKEADAESVDRVDLRIPPPVAPMPKHRSRCVACGCPKVCCIRNFVFVWVVLFILIQAGPLAVLILDLLSMNVEGTTISRYIAEWNMKPAVCRMADHSTTDFNSNCTAPITDYKCIEVEVNVYKYDKTGPFAKDVFLWKSEREYVLDTTAPRCYNLDICSIDATIPWYEYRNATKKDDEILMNKLGFTQEGFVCYYKKIKDGSYVAIKDRNTSFWDVLLWFFLPLAGILLCWLMIFTCLCWYCCPRQRYQEQGGKKHNGGYQEVENVEEGSADHDIDAIKENLVFDDAGEHVQA